MSLRDKAKELSAKGRFGDSTLIHMHPAEVAGLASLVPGGKLPTNPDTGLPEAFFFLPFLAALAPAAAGAGAAGLGALGAGMTAGMTAASALPAAAAALPTAAATTAAAAPSMLASALPAAATAAETATAAALPAAATAAETAAAATPMATTLGTGFVPEAAIAPSINPVAAAAAPTLPPGTIGTPAGGFTAATSVPQIGDLAAGIGPEPFAAASQAAASPIAAGSPLSPTVSGPASSALMAPNVTAGAAPFETAMGAAAPASQSGGGLGSLLGGGAGGFDLMQLAPLAMMMPSGGGGGDEDDEDRDIDTEYKGGDPVFPGDDYEPGINSEWDYFPRYASGGKVRYYGDVYKNEPLPGIVKWRYDKNAGIMKGYDKDGELQMNPDNPIGALFRTLMGVGIPGNQGGGYNYKPKEYQAPTFAPADYQHGIQSQWNYFPQATTPAATPAANLEEQNLRGGGPVRRYAAGGIVDTLQPMGGPPSQQMMDAQAGMAAGPGMQGAPQAMGGPMSQGSMTGGISDLMGPMPAGAEMQPGAEAQAKAQMEAKQQNGDQELIAATVAAIKGESPNPDAVIQAFIATFGENALRDLVARVQQTSAPQGQNMGQGVGQGRRIGGAGDGMSDSVPAMIDGQQPAALSQGEYVIPADVVSGLGNGSTDAGVNQLDELASRVRTMRGGGPVQPKPINPKKVMPV